MRQVLVGALVLCLVIVCSACTSDNVIFQALGLADKPVESEQQTLVSTSGTVARPEGWEASQVEPEPVPLGDTRETAEYQTWTSHHEKGFSGEFTEEDLLLRADEAAAEMAGAIAARAYSEVGMMTYLHGLGFTLDEINYALAQNPVDWDEMAYWAAREIHNGEEIQYSEGQVYQLLIGRGFTERQAREASEATIV